MYIWLPCAHPRAGEALHNSCSGRFIEFARQHGCKHIKAITTPSNLGSIAFHKSLDMQLLGEPNSDGIPVVPDYMGRGTPRVVFWKAT